MPRGRPLGFPDIPFLNWVFVGDLPYPTCSGGSMAFSKGGSCFTFPARRIRSALLSHNFKGLTSRLMEGAFPCAQLKAANDAVAISGVELYQPCPPAGFLSGNQGRARAAEGIQHDFILGESNPGWRLPPGPPV